LDGKAEDIVYTNSLNLFDGHAYEQHKRLGGIGDKLEDFVKKGHQFGIHAKYHTWNFKNWEMMQDS
jgi:hypothetical protein